jgi:rhamnosyltransferase
MTFPISLPDKKNTCAVFTTYHPDNGFVDRLRPLLNQVDCVIIVDNASEYQEVARLDELADGTRIRLIRNHENVGVAAALNQGIAMAIEANYAWALTMDQDSEAEPTLFDIYRSAWKAFEQKGRIGAIGALYRAPGERISQVEPPTALHDQPYEVVEAVITSGCLIRVPVFQALGGFNEALFIDCVDHEYCLRLRRNDHSVLKTTICGLRHYEGQPTRIKFLWNRPRVTNHSPLRRYYMTRNRLWLTKAYFRQEPIWLFRFMVITVKETLRLILFENQRVLKIYATLLGCAHFVTGKMGKLSNAVLLE